MIIVRIISIILMILFILPVFTGQVVNIGNITGVLAGMYFYALSTHPAMLENIWFILLTVFLLICILITAWTGIQMIKAARIRPKGNETLIILGCEIIGLKPSLMQVERLQAALKCLEKYPDMKVICSGGKGKKEKISEAEAMAQWLLAHGISEDRIFKEDRSETTEQNLSYSLEVIRNCRLNTEIAVCSNEFHIYRALRIAEKLGLKASAVPAKTAWWLFMTFFVREVYAILYLRLKYLLISSSR